MQLPTCSPFGILCQGWYLEFSFYHTLPFTGKPVSSILVYSQRRSYVSYMAFSKLHAVSTLLYVFTAFYLLLLLTDSYLVNTFLLLSRESLQPLRLTMFWVFLAVFQINPPHHFQINWRVMPTYTNFGTFPFNLTCFNFMDKCSSSFFVKYF